MKKGSAIAGHDDVMPHTYRPPGLVVTEHEFAIPLDHAAPDGEPITVFAREIADPDGLDRPFLVFFQGGPGFEASRPVDASTPSWLPRALEEFRVLMLDQRGTGRSTPVDDLPGRTPQEQADYLTHFRADSIVRDAEHIREELGAERWSILGQSFGGFCALTYLSIAPGGLREAFFTGGLPPIGPRIDEAYALTYELVIARTRRYFERYPEDRARVRDILARLEAEDVRLPTGDRLTPRRFRARGGMLGMSTGAEALHHIVELPFGSPAFLHDAGSADDFARNPIYAVLHEASWADGGATNWAAHRLLPPGEPDLLTGEHIFPWMFEDIGGLANLREAADILAVHEWPRLYDADALAENPVPCAAAIYADDMYVPRALSEETAAHVRGLKPWLTNEYEHNGLRADGGRVLGRLIDLVRGRS
jgi:pimeloyl-ACP methyl ester carboxylesterase